MGSSEAYSTTRIIFKADANSQEPRTYSERSLIELRMHDIGKYSLRAVDVDNQSKEIFNFPLVKRDQYTFGSSANQPDSILGNVGTYRLWLNANTRNKFHETLKICLAEFISVEEDPPTNSTDKSSTPLDPKTLLCDVHQLGTFIKERKSEEAAQIARKLAEHHIQLRVKSLPRESRDEQRFPIKVKIDGNKYPDNEDGDVIPMFVYPSTTVDEIRTVFHHSHKFPVSNQYFFVKGHLAHNKLTMEQLKITPDMLFLLFVVEQP